VCNLRANKRLSQKRDPTKKQRKAKQVAFAFAFAGGNWIAAQGAKDKKQAGFNAKFSDLAGSSRLFARTTR
jgi:hypothetical protein